MIDIGYPTPSTSSLPTPTPTPSPHLAHDAMEEANTADDLIAGWLGGAVGILVSNPLDVLKVRLQTSRSPSARAASLPTAASSTTFPSSIKPPPSLPSPSVPFQRPDLASLWKAEGSKFLFAGAAGPIIGLAFIDSAFFGGYGFAMQKLGQDRQNPNTLSRVFLAGALSGASCALLQTPIEVVKCRAQAESMGSDGKGKKMGSFRIARMIARTDGLRGFYIGGLMTACRDGISSGIFFIGYFVFRRLLRGQEPFQATPTSSLPDSVHSEILFNGKINKAEVGRIFLAGGVAGSISAVVPYPFDIIKTRLQTSTSASLASSSSRRLTVRQIASEIHADGMNSQYNRHRQTSLYSFLSKYIFTARGSVGSVGDVGLRTGMRSSSGGEVATAVGETMRNGRAEKWTLRILGLKGFLRGLRTTAGSSFIGSAVTITAFEVALVLLSGTSLDSK